MKNRDNHVYIDTAGLTFLLISCTILLVFLPITAQADLTGWKIGIDPGHGGYDTGAVGPTGLAEKEVNLTTSFGMGRIACDANAEVLLTRYTDIYLSLYTRSNFMNSNDVDRSICIHHNASSNPDPNWHLSYVYLGYGWTTSGNMAYDIAHRVTDFNGLGYGWSNCGREGVYEADFHMVRETTMPSVLPEISFISNYWEEQRLYDQGYCKRNGRAAAWGLMDHLGGWLDGYEARDEATVINEDKPDESIINLTISPNPFNMETTLQFKLSHPAEVGFLLYTIQGRVALDMGIASYSAGIHQVKINGSTLPSGVYIVGLKTRAMRTYRKVLLIK